ncbi:MAG: hypothetical protein LAN37_10310 [Acidobacteriia bacterium]|nr:hypothetical protein [Terriglobia bacterium]
MQGLNRLTYWLGWVFFALAVIGRILIYTPISERMIEVNVLPRNFLQLSFLFFLVSIATTLMNREKP